MAGEQTAGKRTVIFGLPGAYTPTCSAKDKLQDEATGSEN
jgi:peroxiredoxin